VPLLPHTGTLASIAAPSPDKVGDTGVAAKLDLRKQPAKRASILFNALRIGCKGALQLSGNPSEHIEHRLGCRPAPELPPALSTRPALCYATAHHV